MHNIDFLNYRNLLRIKTNANMNINHKVHPNTNTIITVERHNKNYKTICMYLFVSQSIACKGKLMINNEKELIPFSI